ncbi:MAG: hypothetical protein ABIG42_04530 [bacterium]
MPFELREMDFGTIIDRGVKLFTKNFATLVVLMGIFFGPFAFASNFGFSLIRENVNQEKLVQILLDIAKDPENFMQVLNPLVEMFANTETQKFLNFVQIISGLLLLIIPLAYLCIMRVLSEHLSGNKPSLGDVIRFGAARFWVLFAAVLLSLLYFSVIIVIVSFILSFLAIIVTGNPITASVLIILMYGVLGFFLMMINVLLPCVVCMEDVGARSAIKRAWFLLRGFMWRTFAIFLLTALGVAIITQVFMSVGGAIGERIHGIPGHTFVAAVSMLFIVIFRPVTLAVVFLLYIDLRIRKEGFDLNILAERAYGIITNSVIPSPEGNNDFGN